MNDLFEIAQKYSKLGWSVVPIAAGNKFPSVEWKLYQSRRPTIQELRTWFEGKPGVGIGIVTGRISDLTIIDSDEYKKAGKLSLELKTPLKARTGGGGTHGYFKFNPAISTFKNADLAVDSRSEGGFVVTYPTIHPNGKQYIWLGGFPTPEKVGSLPQCPDNFEELNPTPPGKPLSLKDVVGVEQGGRDDSLFRLACSLAAAHKPAEEILLACREINRTYKPPLADDVVAQKVEQAMKYDKGNGLNSFNSFNSLPINITKDWPEPIKEAAYHGIAGRIVRGIEPISEADPVALLINFLVGFGNLVGDNAHVKIAADKHPTRLFAVLVGKTSQARKGTSWGYLRNIFKQLDSAWADHVANGLSSGEGLIWAVRDQITKIGPDGKVKVVDDGVADKRLMVVQDEFSSTLRVMQRDGNTLSAVIRRAWDTGNLQTLVKNIPAKASGAHISILAHITNDELIRYLNDTEKANGFGNRFLWVCAKRSKSIPFPKEPNLASWSSELLPILTRAYEAGELTWSKEASSLYESEYPRLSNGKPGMIGEMTARAAANVQRIASIYSLLDSSETIDPVHLEAALAVWDYCERSVSYIFKNHSGDSVADDIYQALRLNPGGMTRTDINNFFLRNISSERISTALTLLHSLKRAKPVSEKTSGRPLEKWFPENEINEINEIRPGEQA